MLKTTILAAFAMTAAASFGQMGMMVPDAKESKPKDLMSFIDKDAYRKLSAPDAYTLTKFIGGLPGNYQTALLRGLVMNAQESKMSKDRAQTSPMAMSPLGDTMMMDDPMMEPMAPKSYMNTIMALQKGQDATDQGLIQTLFSLKPFTEDPLTSPWNEKELDTITKYLAANHTAAMPARLKYTSLAPRMYTSPMIPR